MQLDLADLASVRSFAAAFKSKHKNLHVLLNNAGIMAGPKGTTKQGFELQFGTNHIGHHLLTSLLLDILRVSAPSRIVCTSSCFHDVAMGELGYIDFEDPNFEKRKYNQWASYAQSSEFQSQIPSV